MSLWQHCRISGSALAPNTTAGQALGIEVSLTDAFLNAVTDVEVSAALSVQLQSQGAKELTVPLALQLKHRQVPM